MSENRGRVFISYSRADEQWLQRLQVHLRPLERKYRIEIWDDTRIEKGALWRQEIREALDSAVVAVLLVSADFLASEFIDSNELPPILQAAREKGTRILPVIVSPFLITASDVLSEFQAVNPISQPLVSLSRGEQEAVFVKVAECIQAAVQASGPVPRAVPARQPLQPDEQQEIINQLVVFSMAFFLYKMLDDFYRCEKGEIAEYIFKKTAHFEHNLRWLRDHGYLEMTFQVAALRDGQDIAKMVKLTPVGKFYVKLRREFEARAAQK